MDISFFIGVVIGIVAGKALNKKIREKYSKVLAWQWGQIGRSAATTKACEDLYKQGYEKGRTDVYAELNYSEKVISK